MTGCAAIGCTNSTEKGFIMKYLPKESSRRKQWLINIRRKDYNPKNCCLCEVSVVYYMKKKYFYDINAFYSFLKIFLFNFWLFGLIVCSNQRLTFRCSPNHHQSCTWKTVNILISFKRHEGFQKCFNRLKCLQFFM